MEDYKKYLQIVERNAIKESRLDFKNLYIQLEKASKELFKDGRMRPGNYYDIQLESGNKIRMHFYNDHSSLTAMYKDGTEKIIVSRTDSANFEYAQIHAMSSVFELEELGIGPEYPPILYDVISELRTGEVVKFENGSSYVCTGQDKDESGKKYISLKKTCEIVDGQPKMENFLKQEDVRIYPNSERSVNEFYANIRNSATYDINYTIDTNVYAQERINEIIGNTGRGSAGVLQCGDIELHYKKGAFSNRLKWYDENGKQISESVAKSVIGWFNNRPIVTEFVRHEKVDNSKLFDDACEKQAILNLYKEKNYDAAYDEIIRYCEQEGKSLSINVHIGESKDQKAVSIVFHCEDGKCTPFAIEHENNDFAEEADSVNKLSREDFSALCSTVSNSHYVISKSLAKDEIKMSYPNANPDISDKVSNIMALRKDVEAMSEMLDSAVVEDSKFDQLLSSYEHDENLMEEM